MTPPLITRLPVLLPSPPLQELPHIAKAWKQSDVQARKEDRTMRGGDASTSSSSCTPSGDSDDASSSSASSSSSSSAAAYATYTHYSYLCAPPDGTWVNLQNGIELQRCVSSGLQCSSKTVMRGVDRLWNSASVSCAGSYTRSW